MTIKCVVVKLSVWVLFARCFFFSSKQQIIFRMNCVQATEYAYENYNKRLMLPSYFALFVCNNSSPLSRDRSHSNCQTVVVIFFITSLDVLFMRWQKPSARQMQGTGKSSKNLHFKYCGECSILWLTFVILPHRHNEIIVKLAVDIVYSVMVALSCYRTRAIFRLAWPAPTLHVVCSVRLQPATKAYWLRPSATHTHTN